ncbi:MAG: hypothetical protein JO089_03590, partial [Alphaproteobacteria bacterium]|nr:hypothetical protein [Alphaproteobacteria bacterium]
MRLLRLFLVSLVLHSWSAAAAPVQSVAGLNTFLETNTDTIYDILTHIHAHTMTEHERFLVLTGDNGGYVQCMFHDNDTEIYCESSSGFYQTPKPRISPKQRQAIAAQGFSMEGKQG